MSAPIKVSRDVTFEVTPGEFPEEALAAHLESKGYLVYATKNSLLVDLDTDVLAEELKVRGKKVFDADDTFADNADLDEAAARFRRGEIADALFYLERAFPKDFAGLAQLAPENRP